MTLKTMYHCVPKMIRNDSQMSGSRWKVRMPITAIGNTTLAGKAARNCAAG